MLTEKFNFKDVHHWLDVAAFKSSCPRCTDRAFWDSVPEEIKVTFSDSARQYAGHEWEIIPASQFLKFSTEGDRQSYDDAHTKRRKILGTLFVAELLEGKGQYISQIVDGIWCICEETGWQSSAHNWKRPDDPEKSLPDAEDMIIDLVAAETASMLAWILYIFEDELNSISPQITRRIEYELQRRIMKPYLESTEFWWMSYDPKLHINNWNPWVNSNCMTVFLLAGKDSERTANALYKGMQCIDRYIDRYSDDGGCDEGASYWFHGPAALFACLDILKKATGGMIDISSEPKICRMAEYIYNANLYDNKFMNFADGSASMVLDQALIYRFGEYTHNKQLMDYSIDGFISSITNDCAYYRFADLIPALCMAAETAKKVPLSAGKREYPKEVWYKNLQVLIAHQDKTGTGFTLAAKGGNNAENHNHNDVGNFILLHNGDWVFIDVGVGVYTKQTFGADRYKIWTMRSEYHNLPTIGACVQLQGKSRSARDVIKQDSGSEICLRMDISAAYPSESGIVKYERELRMGKSVESDFTLTDEYKMTNAQTVIMNLMAAEMPKVTDNTICIGDAVTAVHGDTEIEIEKISVQDEKLISVWGDSLYRIKLTNKASVSGEFRITVTHDHKK